MIIAHCHCARTQHPSPRSSDAQRNSLQLMAKKDHGRAMLGLLESGKYSDLTLTCGDDEYRVHRAIVCPHSAFFEAACGGDFAINYPSTASIGPVSTKADGNQAASSRTIA